jgi:proteasome lid subunit RPN8/RPN11
MTEACHESVMDDLTRRRPEHAGALFGPVGCDYLITNYESFTSGGTPSTFSVDGPKLTEMIRVRKPLGLELRGIVHSHPAGVTSLSWGDIDYVTQILNHPKNDQSHLFMPIVCRHRFLPYVVSRTGRISRPFVFLFPQEVSQHGFSSDISTYRVRRRRREIDKF